MRSFQRFLVFLVLVSSGVLPTFAFAGDCQSVWVSSNHLIIYGSVKDDSLKLTQSGKDLIIQPLAGTRLDGRSQRSNFKITPGVTVELRLGDGIDSVFAEDIYDVDELIIDGGVNFLDQILEGRVTVERVFANRLVVQDFDTIRADQLYSNGQLMLNANTIKVDRVYGDQLVLWGWNVSAFDAAANECVAGPLNNFTQNSFKLRMDQVDVVDELLIICGGGVILQPEDDIELHQVNADSLRVETESGNDKVIVTNGMFYEVEIEMGRSTISDTVVFGQVHATELVIDAEDSLSGSFYELTGEYLDIYNRNGSSTNVKLNEVAMTDEIYIESGNNRSNIFIQDTDSEYLEVEFGGGNDLLNISDSTVDDCELDGGAGQNTFSSSRFSYKTIKVRNF